MYDGHDIQDRDSVENNILSTTVDPEADKVQQHQQGVNVSKQVESVDGNGDIFASYRAERHERERLSRLATSTRRSVPPVTILQEGGQSVAHQFSPRTGTQTSPKWNPEDLPKAVPWLATPEGASTLKESVELPQDSAAKKALDLVDGVRSSVKHDPLDFGTRYSSYEKGPVPYKYFAKSDPHRHLHESKGPETDDHGNLVEHQDGACCSQQADETFLSVETNLHRPITPLESDHNAQSASTVMSTSISPNVLQPENA